MKKLKKEKYNFIKNILFNEGWMKNTVNLVMIMQMKEVTKKQ
tara:strand:- start:1756 stop:1881 length:126 start_codon:yes stop_codon:yes gene_type:complete